MYSCTGDDNEQNIKGQELRNVIVLSLSFTSVFTAYVSLQNLQSSLNQEDGLGVISLSCLYACIIFSGVLAPTIVKTIGGKLSLVIPWIVHVVYTGANFFPGFATLLPASVLLGLVSGPQWVSQSLYIARNADSLDHGNHEILSKMNGIFFTCYETTQITGNLVASFILNQGKYETNTSGTQLKVCGAADCPLGSNGTMIEEPEREIVYILLGVFLVFDIIGLFLTVVFLPPLPKSVWTTKVSTKSSLVSCFLALGDWKLLCLVPLILLMAQEQAVLWTDFTKVRFFTIYGNNISHKCLYEWEGILVSKRIILGGKFKIQNQLCGLLSCKNIYLLGLNDQNKFISYFLNLLAIALR